MLPEQKTKKISVSIPADIVSAMEYLAAETNTSRSLIISKLLLSGLYRLDDALDDVEDHGKKTGEALRQALGLTRKGWNLKNLDHLG